MANSPLSVFRFRWLFFSGWLLWALIHACVLTSFDLPWTVAIADSAVSNILLMLVALLLVNTLQFYIPQADRYVMLLAWVATLTIIWLVISRLILTLLFADTQYLLFQKQSLFIRFSFGFLITSTIVLVSVLWYNWQEQKALEERRRETERMAKEAELFKLRQQLQPHFLFNSLNSISALIGPEGKAARKMVLQLSEFLRGTLKKEEHQWTSLGEEVRYLQLYLEIEKVRFGHRLDTAFELAEGTEALQLPALLLQPIVENAIKFGLYDTFDEITITVSSYQQDQALIIEVQNPFDPDITSPKGTGFGLLSIQRRLYLLFGRNDLLQTETSGKLFTTRLTIPQPTK
ncbi:sensor histidine kinase [Flavisolibacter tropicus]|uniref:Histidine kinase n=1 Tax=Flavisolibacter tropicus TaxID=1492898 RepID=A0A172TVA7_9BACT|nr:histidine kinase [Flavisolibacter tropicus]ANE51015.1 histidine kinase [Flavisolibacter tropicus]